MNITSNNTMIFAKEFNGKMYYRAGLSKTNKDGNYENAYIDVKLPKGINLRDRSMVNITHGFLSFYYTTNKEEKKELHWYIVIQGFTTDKQDKKEEDPYEEFGTQITTEDIDNLPLPF